VSYSNLNIPRLYKRRIWPVMMAQSNPGVAFLKKV
jgi:hypothetical protein